MSQNIYYKHQMARDTERMQRSLKLTVVLGRYLLVNEMKKQISSMLRNVSAGHMARKGLWPQSNVLTRLSQLLLTGSTISPGNGTGGDSDCGQRATGAGPWAWEAS